MPSATIGSKQMCTYAAYQASHRSSSTGEILPQPGQIWEVRRQVQCPVDCLSEKFLALYSPIAQQFIQGDSSPRYVMVVNEPEALHEPEASIDPDDPWQVVSVMVLSDETAFVSDVDVLLPGKFLGLQSDLLAETWNVQPMLVCNLTQAIGKRLSREVYDLLLTIGDVYHGIAHTMPSKEKLASVGLSIANRSFHLPEIQAFHHQETAWSDVLSVPVAAYSAYLEALKLAEQATLEAGQLAEELEDLVFESCVQPSTEPG
jgi:hypothetical protein